MKPLHVILGALLIVAVVNVLGYAYYTYKDTPAEQNYPSEKYSMQNEPHVVKAEYNSKVTYSPQSPIEFQDFILTYTGTEKIRPTGSFTITGYNFIAQDTNGSEQNLQWSEMGEIAPLEFTIDGKNFSLELFHSYALNTKLSENELVINLR